LRILTNFPKVKEFVKIRKKFVKCPSGRRGLPTTTEEFDAFHGFMLIKNIKQTYKGGLHFTEICCTNKCIINERYIPEHQNKLSIYDLQNYEFFANFF